MNYLATCSDVVRFWDASSAVSGVGAGVGASGGLELSRTCNTAGAPSNACCWNHSGQVVATGGDDGSINVIKLSGSVIAAGVLSAHALPIYGLAFSARSRKLAAGGEAGVVEVWNLKNSNTRVTFRGHRGPVSCVSFFEKDTSVAAGDKDGRVLLHKLDAPPEEEKSPISLPSSEGHEAVTALAMPLTLGSATSTMLGASHSDGSVRLWDLGRGSCSRELKKQHRGEASGIAFHPQNPSLVATVGLDGLVHCVDIRVGDSAGGSGNGLRSTETGVPLTCVSFHHEGLILAVGASDGTVRLVDLRSARQIDRPQNAFAGPSPPKRGVRDVRFQFVNPRHNHNTSMVSTSNSSTPSFSSNSSFGDRKNASGGGAAARAERAAGGTSSAPRTNGARGGAGGTGGSGGSGKSSSGGVSFSDSRKMRRKKPGSMNSNSNGDIQHPSSPSSSSAATRAAAAAAPATATTHAHAPVQHPPDPLTAAPSSTTPSRKHWSNNSGGGNGGGGGNGALPSPPKYASAMLPATASISLDNRFREKNMTANNNYINSSYVHLLSRGGGGAGEGGIDGRPGDRAAIGGGGGGGGVGPEFSTSAGSGYSDEDEVERRGEDEGENNDRQSTKRAGTRHGGSASSASAAAAVANNRPSSPSRRRRGSRSPERNRREDSEDGGRNAEAAGDAERFDNDDGGGGGYGREKQSGRDTAGFSSARDNNDSNNAVLRRRAMKGSASVSVGFQALSGSMSVSASESQQRRGAALEAHGIEDAGEVPSRQAPLGAAGAPTTAGSGSSAGVQQVVALDRSVLEQILSSHVSGLKEELRQEIRNLHMDVLRQFHSLQDEQAAAMSGFEERLGGLVAENQALRAENDRLRRVY